MSDTITKKGKYVFTKEEKERFASELAEQCSEKSHIELEKKEVAGQYKTKIDRCNTEIQALSQKITNGYEMRDYVCEVKKDFIKGVKQFFCVESAELIATEKLGPSDYQTTIEE